MSSPNSVSSSFSSSYLDIIAGEDNDSALLYCDVCKKPGEIEASQNYHDVPGGMKFALGTSYEPICHFVPHESCRKGWMESVIANKACSICTGEAPVTSVNGRRISEIKKDEEMKKDTPSSKES